MTLDRAKEQTTGRFRLTLRTEDAPQTFEGRVEGTSAPDGRTRLRLDLGQEEPLEYDATVCDAGGYAAEAMFGVVQAPRASGFGGGVWIGWRHERVHRGK